MCKLEKVRIRDNEGARRRSFNVGVSITLREKGLTSGEPPQGCSTSHAGMQPILQLAMVCRACGGEARQ